MKNYRFKAATVTSFVLVTLILTGCSGSNGSAMVEPGSKPATVEDSSSVTGVEPQKMEEFTSTDTSHNGEVQTVETETEQLITTGNLSLISPNPQTTVTEIQSLVKNVGGKISSLTEQPNNDYQNAQAYLTVRIPSEDFDSTVEQLKKLGTVDSLQVSSDDVSDTLRDYSVREKTLRASIDRLIVLMADATDTSSLITIENSLSQKETELEMLLTAQADLEDQVEFSTLEIIISEPADASTPEPGSFWDGLVSGWNTVVGFGAGLLIMVGFLLPWIGVLGVVSLVVFGLVKVVKRRKKARLNKAGYHQVEQDKRISTLPEEDKS